MNKDFENLVDTVLMVGGTSFAITDLRNILSIAILAVELIWFTLKFAFAIRDHVKEKNEKALGEDAKAYIDELKGMVDEINQKEKEDSEDGNA